MISHEHKCVFIHIPKTGGSSIGSLFMPESSNSSYSYPGKHSRLKEKNVKGYFTFSFVRNSFAKMLSHYTFFIKRNLDHRGSFSKFVKYYCSSERTGWQRNDFLPQFDYLSLDGETCDIDFVGKTENLQQDFNVVCDKIGIPQQQLPHKNKSKHKHYTEYYDDETREIVAEKYAKDIEYFNYEFGE
jgi:chondroitin 4-sulfotransferase 11